MPYKTSYTPYFQYFIFSKPMLQEFLTWNLIYRLYFFLIHLKLLWRFKNFNFIYKFNPAISHSKIISKNLNLDKFLYFYNLNKFFFTPCTIFNKIFWYSSNSTFLRPSLHKFVTRQKKSLLRKIKIFKLLKTTLLFYNTLSLSLLKALDISLKKASFHYDSFHLPRYIFLSFNKYEMNTSIINFNKNFMIKLFYKDYIQPAASNLSSKNFYESQLSIHWDNQNLTQPFVLKPANFAQSYDPTGALLLNKKITFLKSNNLELFLSKSPIVLNSLFSIPNFFKFSLFNSSYEILQTYYNFSSNFYFYPSHLNLLPHHSFSFAIRKKIVKVFNFKKFNLFTTPWQYNSFIRFLEFCSGSKIFAKFFFFLNFILNEEDKLRCILWYQKLRSFQKSIGGGFFLYESIEIIYIALKIKDPFFLISWISRTLHKINFWKHRAFFHYLRYVFKYFFSEIFSLLGVKGIKFRLKGKISVTGNARTRKINYSIGKTGMSTYENKILHTLELIRTFTGVMGLQVWLFF